MAYSHLPSRFSEVDTAPEPDRYLEYLDAVGGLEGARSYKERSLELLQPEPGRRFVDVGCGTGDDARALARRVAPEGLVVGVDGSRAMVEEARRRAEDDEARPAVRFQHGDAYRLMLDEGSMDGARADRVLQHLDSPDAAVAEMVRVAKPGGRVVLAEPDWETLVVNSPVRDVTRRILNHATDRIPSGWMGRRLSPCLRRLGLRNVKVETDALASTDYDEADMVMRLRTFAAEARKDGVVARADARRWLDALALADADGTFFCSLTIFIAVGTKPA